MKIKKTHNFSMAHRLLNHRGKCQYLHGHNYKITFTVQSKEYIEHLDELGMIADFADVKSLLCNWIDDNLDHRTMLNKDDTALFDAIRNHDSEVFTVPFNPTAEEIAHWILHIVAPSQLRYVDWELVEVELQETESCCAIASK